MWENCPHLGNGSENSVTVEGCHKICSAMLPLVA